MLVYWLVVYFGLFVDGVLECVVFGCVGFVVCVELGLFVVGLDEYLVWLC